MDHDDPMRRHFSQMSVVDRIVDSLNEATRNDENHAKTLSNVAIDIIKRLNGEHETCKSCSTSCELVVTHVLPPITKYMEGGKSETERDVILMTVARRALTSLKVRVNAADYREELVASMPA